MFDVLSDPTRSLQDCINELSEMNAALARMTLLSEDEDPQASIILVRGEQETREVNQVLDNLEQDWNG